MNSANTKRMAGLAAVVATMSMFGGTLRLADHYASTGADGQAFIARTNLSSPAVSNQVQNTRVTASVRVG